MFNPPSGQRCLEYAQSYISSVGGYINNPNATSACQYCAYARGEDFYKPVGISFDDRWRDLGIFIAFLAFNIIVVRVSLRLMVPCFFFFEPFSDSLDYPSLDDCRVQAVPLREAIKLVHNI